MLAGFQRKWSSSPNRMRPVAENRFEIELPLIWTAPGQRRLHRSLADELADFREFGQPTRELSTTYTDSSGTVRNVPTFVNEFWTAKQRQAHSLHEISYPPC